MFFLAQQGGQGLSARLTRVRSPPGAAASSGECGNGRAIEPGAALGYHGPKMYHAVRRWQADTFSKGGRN